MLLLTLVLHFLLSLRSATSVRAQQPDSTSEPTATTSSSSAIPPALSDAESTITTTTAAAAAEQTWPIHSLFLPIDDPGNLAASIISVHPNHTAYALTCLPPSLSPENASACPLEHTLTLTEGVSTVIYTQFFDDDEISPLTPSAVSVECLLYVPTPTATLDPATPILGAEHASKAACTAHSAISGLGVEAATTTLASTQITYVEVTVTDGQAKLMGTPTPVNGVSGGSGEDGGGEGEENAGMRVRGLGVLELMTALVMMGWCSIML